MLEYYRGLLFLTTNRRDDFDDAFYNRIHVGIEYTALDPESRSNIWRDHLARCTKDNKTVLWTPEMHAALGHLRMNGRDIKNSVRTAYALTQSGSGRELGLSDVLQVLEYNLPENGFSGEGLVDGGGSKQIALQELKQMEAQLLGTR